MNQLIQRLSSTMILAGMAFAPFTAAPALAQELLQVPKIERITAPLPIKPLPHGCLTCPNLTKLPRLQDNLSDEERLQATTEVDEAVAAIRDLPEASPEIISSVDYWESLNLSEKEQILKHDFGRNYNWAAAAVVIAAVQLAYEVAKDYHNRWRPGEARFEHIIQAKDLNYTLNPAFRVNALRDVQARLGTLPAIEDRALIAKGLNF